MDPNIKLLRDGDAASRAGASATPASTADEASAANNRWAKRKKANIPAYIRFERREGAVICSLIDISSTGALIKLSPTNTDLTVDDIPDQLTLIQRHNRETTDVQCAVVRRFGDALGVRFVSQFRTVTQPKRTIGVLPKTKRG